MHTNHRAHTFSECITAAATCQRAAFAQNDPLAAQMAAGWWAQADRLRKGGDNIVPEPPSNPYQLGDRVSHIENGDLGFVSEVLPDWSVMVAWDDFSLSRQQMGDLEPAQPSPVFHQLPQRQQKFLTALYFKQSPQEHGATRDALRNHGYVSANDHWDLIDLTPYGRFVTEQGVKARECETIDLTPVLAGLPTREETINLHENKQLILPPKRPGDNLFFEHDMAKELETLRAEVQQLRQALNDSTQREQTLQAQLVEEQKTVIRQRQELEALKDAKVTHAMNGKSAARAYVTKTLVQVIDTDPYGALFSERDLADDEINAHVDAGWRVVHEDTNSAFDPRADKIVHTRIIRFEQRPTSSRPPRPTAKAEATPDKAEQIIFEAGEIVETAFTFEEALKSGKFSANELAQIGDAEMLASMQKTYEAQAPRRPFIPLPLFGDPSTPVSQIIMEIKHDE